MIIRSNIVMVLAIGVVLWMSTIPGVTDSGSAAETAEISDPEWQNEIKLVLVNAKNRPVVECLIAFRVLPPFDYVLDSLRMIGKGLAELLEHLAITSGAETLLSIDAAQ